MYVKVINPKTDGTRAYDNKGSSQGVVNYLEKEDMDLGADKEMFFNRDNDTVGSNEVVKGIDSNTAKLGQDDAKFYSIAISPDEKELKHLGETKAEQSAGLKEYTRSVMDEYAKNYNRELKGDDIKWYGKVEYDRQYKGTDREVRQGQVRQGDLKEGNNMHVHVIVSRKDESNTKKLSPLANEKGNNNSILNGQKVQRGFNRDQFKERSEKTFDSQFNYNRNLEDSYRYYNTMKNGSTQDKVDMMERSAEKMRQDQVASKDKKQAEQLNPDQEQQRGRGLGRSI